MKKRVNVTVAAAASLALLAAVAAPAHGALHLKLDKSTPEADQVLAQAPDKLVLDFSQRPELAVSRVMVKGSDGGDAELSEVRRSEEDETILWVAFEQPLGEGTYAVSWLTGSGDGHPVRGEFSFTVSSGRVRAHPTSATGR